MKKLKFTKLNSVRAAVSARPDYPGYLFFLPNLPGIDLVLCRASRVVGRGNEKALYVLTNNWYAYDRETGLCIRPYAEKTREALATAIAEVLENYTVETYLEYVNTLLGKRIAAILTAP